MKKDKAESTVFEESDIGGRIQRGVSVPRFLDRRINQIVKSDKRFKGNRSLFFQLAAERMLKDMGTRA